MENTIPKIPECTLTDKELVAKIDEWNGKLCKTGGRAWSLSVPSDPNNDPDLLIGQLCLRFELLSTKNRLLKNAMEQFVASYMNDGNGKRYYQKWLKLFNEQ